LPAFGETKKENSSIRIRRNKQDQIDFLLEEKAQKNKKNLEEINVFLFKGK
jgi:hypothetical protein